MSPRSIASFHSTACGGSTDSLLGLVEVHLARISNSANHVRVLEIGSLVSEDGVFLRNGHHPWGLLGGLVMVLFILNGLRARVPTSRPWAA